MRVAKLDENENMLKKVLSDIETINTNTSQFFFNGFSGDVNQEELESFNKVKSWTPIYSIEDSCAYASELAYVLTDGKEYALISHYNTGGSILDHTKILFAQSKDELKQEFGKLFAFNGLDSVTDKRVYPRFDFDALVDNFPELQNSENVKRPKLK